MITQAQPSVPAVTWSRSNVHEIYYTSKVNIPFMLHSASNDE